MRKTRRKHSKDFKAEVIQLVITGARTVPELSVQYAIAESSLYNWVRQAKIDSGRGPAGSLTSVEKAELSALRKENRELRKETEFLKKAAAFFASQKK